MKAIVKTDPLDSNIVIYMAKFVLNSHKFTLCLQGIAEHVSKCKRHGGNGFVILQFSNAVDRFQCIEQEMGVDPCFQRFHLRIQKNKLVLIILFDSCIQGFHHGVIFIIKCTDLICPIQITGGLDQSMSGLRGHFAA